MKKLFTLKKNYEFKNVLTKGRFCKGEYITIYLQNRNDNKNVIGIAISKKIAKANKRNRVKRLIRESYRLNKENMRNGFNIVYILNKNVDIKSLNYKCINMDMVNIFKRIGIYK